MKYIKMLALLAVAAAALMAFAGTASATTLTSPTGTTYTGEIHAIAIGEAPTLHGFSTITCTESTTSGKVETHGAGVTVEGKLSTLTFGGCTPTNHVTVTKLGKLAIHTDEANEAHPKPGPYDGTLTSSGTRVVIENTSVGITCEFETENTPIGTLTGGHDPILHIQSAKIPRVGGSIFCGSNGVWTGTYTVTTPTELFVD